MSVFSYNGVTLPFPLHTNFNQKAVYDPSGTDFIGTEFDIQLSCLINTDYGNLLLSGKTGKGGSDPADLMNQVRKKLLTPRKALSVGIGSSELIPTTGRFPSDNIDVMNGPHPQYCKIVRMTNTTFFMTYAIKATMWEDSSSSDRTDVLYNRWTESHSIDELSFSKITRRGSYQIRSDNLANFTADEYRKRCCDLGVNSGWLRTRQHFSVSEDGLKVNYEIEDTEQFKQPPTPAYKADGSYSESCKSLLNRRYATVSVTLWGSKATPQDKLISQAIFVAASKLTQTGKVTIPTVWEINVPLYRNSVTVKLGGMFITDLIAAGLAQGPQPNGNKLPLGGMDWTSLGKTPVSDDKGGEQYVPPFFIRGTAGNGVFAAGYHSPDDGAIISGDRYGNNDIPGQGAPQPEPEPEPEPEE